MTKRQEEYDYLEGTESLQEVLYAFIHSYIDWVSEQPEFAKFLISARFSVMQGEDQERLVQKNKSRNQKIFSEISNYADSEFLKSIPHELLLSLVIGSTENHCGAWLSQRVPSNPKIYQNTLAKAALGFFAKFELNILISVIKKAASFMRLFCE